MDIVTLAQIVLATVLVVGVVWGSWRQRNLFPSKARFIARNLAIPLGFVGVGLSFAYSIFHYSRDYLFVGAAIAVPAAVLLIWGNKGMVRPTRE